VSPPRKRSGDLPFSVGAVNRRINDHLKAGAFPELKSAEIGLLRALASLANWETGVIPYSAQQIAVYTRIHRDTVSRMRVRLEAAGLLVERWRTSTQVQYALGESLRGG
jgi:DNA-binding MarR family transcriptional regulator